MQLSLSITSVMHRSSLYLYTIYKHQWCVEAYTCTNVPVGIYMYRSLQTYLYNVSVNMFRINVCTCSCSTCTHVYVP